MPGGGAEELATTRAASELPCAAAGQRATRLARPLGQEQSQRKERLWMWAAVRPWAQQGGDWDASLPPHPARHPSKPIPAVACCPVAGPPCSRQAQREGRGNTVTLEASAAGRCTGGAVPALSLTFSHLSGDAAEDAVLLLDELATQPDVRVLLANSRVGK